LLVVKTQFFCKSVGIKYGKHALKYHIPVKNHRWLTVFDIYTIENLPNRQPEYKMVCSGDAIII